MADVQHVFDVGFGICAFFIIILAVLLVYETFLLVERILTWIGELPLRMVKWVARIPRRRRRRRQDRHFATLRQVVRRWDDVGEKASQVEPDTLPYHEAVDEPAAVPADRSIHAGAG